MISIGLNSVAYNQAVITVGDFSAGFANVDVQISTRPDFKWVLSPMAPNIAPVGVNVTITGLNQRTSYFVRMRERNGAVVGQWTKPIGFYTPNNSSRVLTYTGSNKDVALIVAPERVVGWTTPAELAGHPPSNLGTDNPNDQWWADVSGGGYAFEMEHSGAPIDTIALLETNAHAGMTISVKGGATLANVRSGGPSFTQGPQTFHASANMGGLPGYHALVRLGAPQSYRFWRVEIAGTAALGRFAATYACLGKARSAGKNMADDSQEVSIDLGVLERTREGNADRRHGFQRGRKVDFDIAMMNEGLWETQFADLRNIIGQTDPALVIPNSKTGAFLHDRILYGPVQLRVAHPNSRLFTASLTVASQI